MFKRMSLLTWSLLVLNLLAVSFAENPVKLVLHHPLLQCQLELIENGNNSDLSDTYINRLTDKMIEHINTIIRHQAKEPLPLPDINEKLGHVNWITLYNGQLYGISTLVRKGDCIIKNNFPNYTLHGVFGITNVTFDYDFKGYIFPFNINGEVKGGSVDNKATIDIALDMDTLWAKLVKFELNSIGKISLKFTGNVPENILKLLSEILIELFENKIKNKMESEIREQLLKIITAYNKIICKLLENCPEGDFS